MLEISQGGYDLGYGKDYAYNGGEPDFTTMLELERKAGTASGAVELAPFTGDPNDIVALADHNQRMFNSPAELAANAELLKSKTEAVGQMKKMMAVEARRIRELYSRTDIIGTPAERVGMRYLELLAVAKRTSNLLSRDVPSLTVADLQGARQQIQRLSEELDNRDRLLAMESRVSGSDGRDNIPASTDSGGHQDLENVHIASDGTRGKIKEAVLDTEDSSPDAMDDITPEILTQWTEEYLEKARTAVFSGPRRLDDFNEVRGQLQAVRELSKEMYKKGRMGKETYDSIMQRTDAGFDFLKNSQVDLGLDTEQDETAADQPESQASLESLQTDLASLSEAVTRAVASEDTPTPELQQLQAQIHSLEEAAVKLQEQGEITLAQLNDFLRIAADAFDAISEEIKYRSGIALRPDSDDSTTPSSESSVETSPSFEVTAAGLLFRDQLTSHQLYGDVFTQVLESDENQAFQNSVDELLKDFLGDAVEPNADELDIAATTLWEYAIAAVRDWSDRMAENQASDQDNNPVIPDKLANTLDIMLGDKFLDQSVNAEIGETTQILLLAWKKKHVDMKAKVDVEHDDAAEKTQAELAQKALDGFDAEFDIPYIEEQIAELGKDNLPLLLGVHDAVFLTKIRKGDLQGDLDDEKALTNFQTAVGGLRDALKKHSIKAQKETVPTLEDEKVPGPFSPDWVAGYRLVSEVNPKEGEVNQALVDLHDDIADNLNDALGEEIQDRIISPDTEANRELRKKGLREDIREIVKSAVDDYVKGDEFDKSKVLTDPDKKVGGDDKSFNDFVEDAAGIFEKEIAAAIAAEKEGQRADAPPAQVNSADAPTTDPTEADPVVDPPATDRPHDPTEADPVVDPPATDRPQGWRRFIPARWRRNPSEGSDYHDDEKKGPLDKVKEAINKAALDPNKKRWVLRLIAGALGAVASYGAGKEWGLGFLPRTVAATYLASLSLVGYHAYKAREVAKNAEGRGETTKARLATAIYKSLDFLGDNADLVGSFFVGATAEALVEGVSSVVHQTHAADHGSTQDPANPSNQEDPANPSNQEDPANPSNQEEPTNHSNQKEPTGTHTPGGSRGDGTIGSEIEDIASPSIDQHHHIIGDQTYVVQQGDSIQIIARDVDAPVTGVWSHGGLVDGHVSKGVNTMDILMDPRNEHIFGAGTHAEGYAQLQDLYEQQGGFVAEADLDHLSDPGVNYRDLFDKVQGGLQPGMEIHIPSVDLNRAIPDNSALAGLPQVPTEVALINK